MGSRVLVVYLEGSRWGPRGSVKWNCRIGGRGGGVYDCVCANFKGKMLASNNVYYEDSDKEGQCNG